MSGVTVEFSDFFFILFIYLLTCNKDVTKNTEEDTPLGRVAGTGGSVGQGCEVLASEEPHLLQPSYSKHRRHWDE